MPADFTGLNTQLDAMKVEVAKAIAKINSIAALINEALAADNTIDAENTAKAQAVVTQVVSDLKTALEGSTTPPPA